MNRKKALKYLNYRLEMERKHRGVNSHITFFKEDLDFITEFILWRTDKVVDPTHLTYCANNHQASYSAWLSALYTFLTLEFNIAPITANVEEDKVGFIHSNIFNSFMGTNGTKIIRYE